MSWFEWIFVIAAGVVGGWVVIGILKDLSALFSQWLDTITARVNAKSERLQQYTRHAKNVKAQAEDLKERFDSRVTALEATGLDHESAKARAEVKFLDEKVWLATRLRSVEEMRKAR